MKIRFTPHAMEKLPRLNSIGVSKKKVVEVVENPEKVEKGYWGRKIAQGSLTSDLILRVVYEQIDDEILIITIYPGEKRRYK